MSHLFERYFDSDQLKKIAAENDIPHEFYKEFEIQVDIEIENGDKEDDCSDEENKKWSIIFAVEKISRLYKALKDGHSRKWAEKYAAGCAEESDSAYFNNTFFEFRFKEPEFAKQELLIHCKALGADELYTKYLLFLMFDNLVRLSDAQEQTKNYLKVYREQIASGHSEIFAHHYANLKASKEYVEEYCFWYAKTYEHSIQNGKSDQYASIYADKIGSHYADYYGRYGKDKVIDEGNHEFAERQIFGYMKAWEYAHTNNLEDKDNFIRIYDNLYINTYYDDKRKNGISEVDIDNDILKRALEKFNRLNNGINRMD